MADKTTAELITATKDAIYAIATGAQSYTMDGRTYTKADLDKLRRLLKELIAMKLIEDGGRPMIAAADFSPMGYS